MTTRNQVLTLARSQLGYTEERSNITKYWAELNPGLQGSPWCAAFTGWVYKHCGSDLLLTGPSAPYYTPSMEAWAKATRRWKMSKDCLPGDVLIYGGNGAVHTGILSKQDGPNRVIAIEGNTGPDNGGSQTDGGGVYLRRRPRSWVRGCISMESEMTVPLGGGMTDTVPAARKVAAGPLDEDGEIGPQTVGAWQKYLGIAVTGRLTRDVVRDVQSRWLGRPRTGRFDKGDIIALQRKVSAVPDGIWGQMTTVGLQRFLNKRLAERKASS